MKRMIKMLGLSVVAALAVSALSVASASASQPKFEPETAGFPTFTAEGGAGKLEPTFGTPVECTGNTASGEVTGASTVGNVFVTYTGCTRGANTCASAGKAEGEIFTNKVKGFLVYLETGSAEPVGLVHEPDSGNTFVSFTCGETNISVTGKVIGVATPVNAAFSTTGTLTFNQTGGIQEWTSYKAPSGCASVSGITLRAFGFVQSGIQSTQTITFSKKVKLVSTKCE